MSWGRISIQRRLLGLLGGVAVVLAARCSGSSSSHSLRYFYMGVSEPSQRLPQFISVGYVDDQPFIKYDSFTKRAEPQVPWVEKAGKDDPHYWEGNTQNALSTETVFRASLEILLDCYNQSHGGLHTWQRMVGCEVGLDGRLCKGHEQFAYDGEDFLALDRETLTWTAPVPQALSTKTRWEEKLHWAKRINTYLEQECVPWLRRYLDYGQESLLRTERPMAKVALKKGYKGRETLFCQLYGFYPREIEVTWVKDGQVWDQDTFHGGVVPNSDGTYHTWRSIEVDPKEKFRYRCRVEHDSLPRPLDLTWEDPASNQQFILGILIILLILLMLCMMVLILIIRRRKREFGSVSHPSLDSWSNSQSSSRPLPTSDILLDRWNW